MSPWRRFALVGTLLLLGLPWLSGCSAVRDATRAGLEAAKAYYAEHKDELKAELEAKAKEAALALFKEGERALAEKLRESEAKMREHLDAKFAAIESRLAERGVDPTKIDSIASGLQAIKQVQEDEKKSGKPYQPVTGSLITDVIAAYLASKAGLRGASMLAVKKPAGPIPPA